MLEYKAVLISVGTHILEACPAVCCAVVQRAHIPKAIMSVLEKGVDDEQKAVEKARRVEEERLTQQEMLYQVSH